MGKSTKQRSPLGVAWRWLKSWRHDLPLVAACLLMVAFGVWLRAQRLGFPGHMTWDENHFVVNARGYLAGVPDWNDHPPLGKLLMALPMWLMGDTATAWRLAPLLLGCASVVSSGLLAAWATRRPTAFFIGAALPAIDGFMIAYSRAALLDGMLTCLCLTAMALAFRARTAFGVALASVVLGSACSVKFSAVVFLPLLVWAALSKPAPLRALVTTLTAPVTYAAWFSLGLGMTHKARSLTAVLAETRRLYLSHAGANLWKHPLLSHWYEWFLPTRPIFLRSDGTPDDRLRQLTTLGNPLLWWLVDAAVVAVALSAVFYGVRSLWIAGLRCSLSRLRTLLDGSAGRRLALLLCWCAPIAPWILSKRDSYIYHYLPAYAFGLVLLAAVADALYSRRRTVGLVAVLTAGLVSAYYAPLWGELPLGKGGMERRLFLERWR